MLETKVSLTVVVPGATMISKQECLKQLENSDDESLVFNHQVITVYDKDNKNQKVLHIKTRKCIPARQSLNICKEAYEAMISSEIPYKVRKVSEWLAMSKKQRLEKHLDDIAAQLGGVVGSYVIFED